MKIKWKSDVEREEEKLDQALRPSSDDVLNARIELMVIDLLQDIGVVDE